MSHVALLTVHGMGPTSRDYAHPLFARLRTTLAGVDYFSVYYQDILKPNQEAVWARVANDTPLRYPELRRFLLFGFGDAAGLENRKEDTGSAYELAQTAIAAELLAAHAAQPNVPVVFLAQSLGCQVLSSYLYDAQKAAAGLPVVAGIWKDVDAWSLRTLGRRLGADERAFLAGGTCSALLTTGCNIPIFVAAHKQLDIKPIARPTPDFVWINLYAPEDALGWPLQPLSQGYDALVEDRAIHVGHGLVDHLLKSWNPWSHTLYWHDAQVLAVLEDLLDAPG